MSDSFVTPMDYNLPSSSVHGIFQARILAYMFSRSVVSNSLQPHGLQPTRILCPWGFSRQEYWSGLPCSSPEDLPNPGIEPTSPVAPVSQEGSLPLSHRGSPLFMCIPSQNKHKDHSSFCYLKKKDLMKSRDLPSRTMKKHHIFHLNAGGSQGLLRSSVGGTHRGCHS